MDRILVILLMGGITLTGLLSGEGENSGKVNGVSLVAPRDSTDFHELSELTEIKANWVAVIPFAFSKAGEPGVQFNHPRQWWGEKAIGIQEAITKAHDKGLKVMVKPHVWVRGEGWPGEFDLNNDPAWKKWEKEYAKYILSYAQIAELTKAEIFCIGTEFRIAVRKRPKFWRKLIREVRKVYRGHITYAANWDNYEQISFWKELDFIGIDAYFPMSESAVPSVAELKEGWYKLRSKLEELSRSNNRKILFTEFGYRSTDYAADGHWKHNLENLRSNETAQSNGYEALLSSLWHEPWMYGGFLWKWHLSLPDRPGFSDKAYSPQNKSAMRVIRKYYGEPLLVSK